MSESAKKIPTAELKVRLHDVVCLGCGESYHETSPQFRPDAYPNGAMFSLKPHYRENAWTSFPENEGIFPGDLECPGCGYPYCDSDGKLFAKLVEKADPANDRYKEIRALRRAGMSLREVGKQLGLSHSRVDEIEKRHIGRKKPSKLPGGKVK